MGFNLSGYLLKGKPSDVQRVLEEAFGSSLEVVEPVSFETATCHKPETSFLDVFCTEKGLFVFTDYNVEERIARKLSGRGDVLTFELSETSMAFFFRSFKKGVLDWEDGVVFENGIRQMDDVLQVTKDTDVVSEIFPRFTQEYTGVLFHEVAVDAPALRYRMSGAVPLFLEEAPTKVPVPEKEELPVQKEARKHLNSFHKEIRKRKFRRQLRFRDKAEVCSFETYLREQGCSEPEVAGYCRELKEQEGQYLRPVTGSKQNSGSAGTIKPSKGTLKLLVTMLVFLTVVYSIMAWVAGWLHLGNLWKGSYYVLFLIGVPFLFLLKAALSHKGLSVVLAALSVLICGMELFASGFGWNGGWKWAVYGVLVASVPGFFMVRSLLLQFLHKVNGSKPMVFKVWDHEEVTDPELRQKLQADGVL